MSNFKPPIRPSHMPMIRTTDSGRPPDLVLLTRCHQANHFGIYQMYELYLAGHLEPEIILRLLKAYITRMQSAAGKVYSAAQYAERSYSAEMEQARELNSCANELTKLHTTIYEETSNA